MHPKNVSPLLVFALLLCIAPVAQATPAAIPPPPLMLQNGGFEAGGDYPAFWTPMPVWHAPQFGWGATEAQQGEKSVRISSQTPIDGGWMQYVAVEPHTEYRLSGWIRTQNVVTSNEWWRAGANLSIYGTYVHTPLLVGTNDWTYRSLTFDSGDQTGVIVAARLGYWNTETTGTAWFDDVVIEPVSPPPAPAHMSVLPYANPGKPPCAPDAPAWKILALVYESTDFTYEDNQGQTRHFVSGLSQPEKDRISHVARRFGHGDLPLLDTCAMRATVTVRYVSQPLTRLTPLYCNDYVPSPSDAAPDRDPAFDSVIAVWDGSGTDLITGESLSIQGCAWAWGMGTGQTYDAIPADYFQYQDTNIIKHEWGHSITFYHEAMGAAPLPPVDNHQPQSYVNCRTGQPYILQDDSDLNPIPNSIYHNTSGFTHDYYSGMTATVDMPTRCLGITSAAWHIGGPVTRPPGTSTDERTRWRSPADDTIGVPVGDPYVR